MTGLNRRVVLITGAARGQGRSHAIRFATEGAAVALVDICAPICSVQAYPMASPADLAETADLVVAAGGQCLPLIADVRDRAAMASVIQSVLTQFGRLDVVVANAGIAIYGRSWQLSEQEWRDVLDTNLTGVWNTIEPALSALARSPYSSIVVTSSLCGLRGVPHLSAYVAAKHGLIALVTTLGDLIAADGIRINAVCPSAVDAPPARLALGVPADLTGPGFMRFFESALPVGLLDVNDVTDAVAWLASPSCELTGVALPVDAGASGR